MYGIRKCVKHGSKFCKRHTDGKRNFYIIDQAFYLISIQSTAHYSNRHINHQKKNHGYSLKNRGCLEKNHTENLFQDKSQTFIVVRNKYSKNISQFVAINIASIYTSVHGKAKIHIIWQRKSF